MTIRIPVFSLLLIATAVATRIWSEAEFNEFNRTFSPNTASQPENPVRGPRRFNYLERIYRLCEFLREYQVADSFSPDFGGIIEAEHLQSVIETDNTQEAIWVWSRWYELTGRDDYRTQIRRAWTYVLRHPAYQEHGGQPSSVWYAVWNCGLGFMAETRYRAAYSDTTYRRYADTCRSFYLGNPLSTTALHQLVTSQSSGMAYDYAVEFNDATLRDSALARLNRVRQWIEQSPTTNLAIQNWAMSGGTAFWGVAHAWCRHDTTLGNPWLRNYAQYLPGFYPTGNWNCSHNIWLANAYRAAAEALGHENWWLLHQYLTDTLLFLDADGDGGIPATWTDPNTADQTWVSTYLDFMGMDVFVTPVHDNDLSLLQFTQPNPRQLLIAPCTLQASIPVTNVGRYQTSAVVQLTAPGTNEQVAVGPLDFIATDTVSFAPIAITMPGRYELVTALSGDDNPSNDTLTLPLHVHGIRTITGHVTDSLTAVPIHAWLYARIAGDTAIWDSCETNRSGGFTLRIIDTLVAIKMRTWPPYYNRTWHLDLLGDTTLVLATEPAQILIAGNDSASNYAEYYTSTLDTLGITWCLWNCRTQGTLPYSILDRLQAHTLIWYSGDAEIGTVPPADRESLAAALNRGINLLLTGQNIAEELSGTPFLQTTLGARFDSSGYSGLFVFGNRADSVGERLKGTSTAGGNGANNQTSRDIISPLAGSHGMFVYDSVTPRYAAIRRDAGTAKAVLLGFGFESVNQPPSRPSYWNRMQVLGLILNWFNPGIGIAERLAPKVEPLQPFPTIIRSQLFIPPSSADHKSSNCFSHQRYAIIDAAGRTVLTLRPGLNDISSLATGVYFLTGDGQPRRLLLLP